MRTKQNYLTEINFKNYVHNFFEFEQMNFQYLIAIYFFTDQFFIVFCF